MVPLPGTVDGDWLGSAVALVVAVAVVVDDVPVPGGGWGDGVQATNSITSGTTIGNSLRILTSTSIVRGSVCAVKVCAVETSGKTTVKKKRPASKST
ncbi:hypothetical protein StoSoilA2_29310 [Arthrobacter sp. StoSoilA2]|nr:hypothetical protein StoSoilA2_29310 [Arthrobacter sp. StoSoilA2]